MIRRILLTVLIGFVMTSCGYVGQEPPRIAVDGVQALPSSGPIPNFLVDLRVVNPNNQALRLNGVFYEVFIEGNRVFTGASGDLPTINGFDEQVIQLNANPDLLSTVGLVADLFSRIQGGGNGTGVEYVLEAKVDVQGFRRNFNITESGQLDLSRYSRGR